jgi:hypothetical protein
MEPLAFAGTRATGPSVGRSSAGQPFGLRSLAWIGGLIATICAVGVAAVLALFFAATMVVIGVMSAALLALGGAAYRARKTFRSKSDPTILEARHLGGHSWVAYGWDQRSR